MDWRNRSPFVALALSLCLACSPVVALATSEGLADAPEQPAVEIPTNETAPEELPAEAEAPAATDKDEEASLPAEGEAGPDATTDELPGAEEEPTENPDELTEQTDPPSDGWYSNEVDGETLTYYYVDSAPVTGAYEVDGVFYLFDDTTGARIEKTGWVQDSAGDWYYINSDYSLKTGWFKSGSSWYYLDPTENGKMAAGKLFDVDGVTYVAKDNGVCPANAWVKVGSDWYYTKSSCAVRTGWVKYSGAWYYLDPDDNGKMVAGTTFSVNGVTYVAKDNGVCPANAWVKVGSDWYYTNSSCAVRKGWAKSGGKWYYLDPAQDGKMATGWIEDNGKRYYLESSGAMATGWKKVDGEWYYLNSGGDAAMGWKDVGSSTYYFDPDNNGAMVHGCKKTIGGQEYEFTDSGALKAGWVKEGGTWYWYQPNGNKLTGWIQDKGNWYYLDPASDGAMVTGWFKIDGEWNAFDKSSGVWRTANSLFINGVKYPKKYGSSTNWFILVDDSKTKLMIYHWEGGEWMPYRMWSITTGAKSTPTPKGVFSTGYKQYTFGENYSCYYATLFCAGDYLFHSTVYQRGTFKDLDPVLNGHRSHGCVRMAIDNAKWIYDYIPYGTRVYIY